MSPFDSHLGSSAAEAFGVVALGVLLIVAAALLAQRAVWRGTGRRFIWQAALLAVVALLLTELLGAGRAAVWAVRQSGRTLSSIVPSETTRPDEPVAAPLSVTASAAHKNPTIEIDEHQTRRAESPAIRLAFRPHEADRPFTEESATERDATRDTAGVVDVGVHSSAGMVAAMIGTWLLGMLAMTLRLGWNLVALVVLRFRSRGVADPAIESRVSLLATKLSLRRAIRIVESPALQVPVAFGFLRPTVGLPVGFAADFTPQQQDAMLAHELAHLSSGDALWQLLSEMLLAVLWWHPGVWLLRRRLHLAGELAADEASVIVPNGPDHLAACLIKLGRRLAPCRQFAWSSVTGGGYRSELGRRVHRLLHLAPEQHNAAIRGAGLRRTLMRLVVACGLAVGTILATVWLRPHQALAEANSGLAAVRHSWRRSVVGSFVSAFRQVDDDAPTEQPDRSRIGEEAIGEESFSDAEELAQMVDELRGQVENLSREMRELQRLADGFEETMRDDHEREIDTRERDENEIRLHPAGH